MAKGYEQNKERLNSLSLFGKNLARRSSKSCELCSTSGTGLQVVEVPPLPEEPEYGRVIFICETCHTQIQRPKQIEPNHWRSLSNAMWSEVPAVQVMALRMLRHLAKIESWADDLLQQAYVEPEVEAWVDEATIGG